MVCLFCRAFGREEPESSDGRKRKRSQNIQTYGAPWRIDKMKNHNKSMHATKWDEYQKCANAEKKNFFDIALECNTDLNIYKVSSTERIEITADKEIVEIIIEDLLYLAEDDQEEVLQVARKKDFLGYEPIHSDSDDEEIEYYRAIIPSTFQYQAVLKAVGSGLSFRQTVKVLEEMRDLTGLSNKFGTISRRKVSMYVRIYCGEAFQTIAEALRFCWAFSIALDGGNKASVPYLDFRLRFVLGFELFNVHLIACPMYESHTGDNMFALTGKILDVLCQNWKEKIIGVTTDGASNMTGCHVGLVTQIERVSNKGFFRIWCAAHQLDLIVQDRFKSMFNDSFVHVIQGITGHLRRQKNLIQRMKSTCPRFIDSRWLSMGRLLSWLIIKRREVQAHFDERNPPCRPPDEWWIEVYALDKVVKTINITFKALQGKQLLLDQQKEFLEKLRSELMRIGMVATSGSTVPLPPGVFQVGSFRMTFASAETFLLNIGVGYVVELVNRFKESNESQYNALLERIVYLFLKLVQGIFTLSPKRNESNAAVSTCAPPALPLPLVEGGSFRFTTALLEQRNRLLVTFSAEYIDDLEHEFIDFERRYHTDGGFKELVQNTSKCESFGEAWGWLYEKYPRLATFSGGFATTFPGTSTVESDFSVIGWEKDEYRTLLSDLSLEGILHAKQMKELAKIQVVLNILKN